jgi:hypothetical protein
MDERLQEAGKAISSAQLRKIVDLTSGVGRGAAVTMAQHSNSGLWSFLHRQSSVTAVLRRKVSAA